MADVSRQSWIDNTSLENVRIADRVFVLLNQASEYAYTPGYTQSFIGVRSGGKPCNFFTVTPKKKDSVISIRVTQTAETDAAVKAASKDGTFQYKDGWYGVHLSPNGDHAPLIPVLLQAEKEFKKEKGNAALTKTSEWKEAAAEMAELEKNAQMETDAANKVVEKEKEKEKEDAAKAELERIQAETAKAKAEAAAALEKQKAEAEAAKAELARIQAETEKAKAEAAAAIAAAQAEAEAAQKAAKAATAPKANNTKGALNGLFSIGENKKVRFSMGNLQFNAKKYEFRFAEHQYDMIGNDNMKIAHDYDGWIDLFGYGTSGYMGCQPYETSDDNKQYPNQDIANTKYDWGVYNPISNGGNKEGLWRTLTKDEWEYLLKKRPNAERLHIKARVNGVEGMLLLPDGFFDHRVRIPIDATPSGYDTNSYDLTLWATLEAAGVVFLPCAGYRYFDNSDKKEAYHNYLGYWSSSKCGDYSARLICSGGVTWEYYRFGLAVRLVQDVK